MPLRTTLFRKKKYLKKWGKGCCRAEAMNQKKYLLFCVCYLCSKGVWAASRVTAPLGGLGWRPQFCLKWPGNKWMDAVCVWCIHHWELFDFFGHAFPSAAVVCICGRTGCRKWQGKHEKGLNCVRESQLILSFVFGFSFCFPVILEILVTVSPRYSCEQTLKGVKV